MTTSTDTKESVQFLQWAHPQGPWLLTAIPVSRQHPQATSPPSRTFMPGEEEAVEAWIREYADQQDSDGNGIFNLYWSVNATKERISKKARRADIKEMHFLHVDVDPRRGYDLDSERERILGLLSEGGLPDGIPEPSCVIDSGGGLWGLWKLDRPQPIGSEQDYRELARYNLQLELLFGADSCHNVDRIARLPGTVNTPDEKKRAKGRVSRVASVVRTSNIVYPLGSFTQAAQVQGGTSGFSTGSTVTISENVKRFQSLDELENVKPYARVIIAKGYDPDNPDNFPSRSEALWYVLCEMVRSGCSDDDIFSVVTDPDWDISGHILSQPRPDEYAKRQIERAREWAVDPLLAEFNEKYAVIQNAGGGSCRIVYEDTDAGGAQLVYQTPGDFKAFHSNIYVESDMGTDKDGNSKTKKVEAGSWWFSHPQRRSYRRISFEPGSEVANDSFNLWRGFKYDAQPGGSCDLYLEHIRNVIANGENDVYEYLLSWMALAVQEPAQPGHTAIVLRGGQGAGKGTFARWFLDLFGSHGKQIVDGRLLVGHFNAHLRDCIALFADEAVAVSDKAHEAVLKAIVTEESMMITAKGKESSVEKNCLHVLMASNSDWVVPTGMDDRRFVVLDVANGQENGPEYWSALNQQMEGGGAQALLYMLSTRDLKGFDPRQRPKTEALQDQKIRSFDPLVQWLYDALQDGAVGGAPIVEAGAIVKGHVEWECRQVIGSSPGHRLSQMLRKLGVTSRQATNRERDAHSWRGEVVDKVNGNPLNSERPMLYMLPSLTDLRTRFDQEMGGPYVWNVIELAPERGNEVF